MSNRFIPNSFQVPNAIIDDLMSILSGAEFKCYMLVVRQTTGWNKQEDAVSISQMMEKCNLSNKGVINACDKLVEMGLLSKTTGYRGMNVFSVNFDKIPTCEVSSPVNSVHSTCEVSSQEPVNSVHTQNTTKQNNNTKNTTLTSCINAHANEPVKISAPPKKKSSVAKNSALALLAEFGITGQLAEDFIAHRKAKNAPINETALKGFQREADKAGIPIQRAVEIAIERNWQGFKANWDWGDGFAKPNQNTAQHAKRGNPSAPIDWSGVVI